MLEYVKSLTEDILLKIKGVSKTSKTCGDCGTKNTKLKLSDREWVCESCGSIHDRDFNAACRIEEEGKRLARLLV